MTTFCICRHGETENNKAKRFQGWIDTPLTEEGVLNAQSSAKKISTINLDMIISSDLGRAFRTAYIIARDIGFTDDIQCNSGFREMNYGDFANQPHASYPNLTTQENETYTPPGGESLISTQQRVLGTVRKVATDNVGKSILIVGHDGTINSIRASIEGEDMGEADLTHNPHDFVAKFEYANGKLQNFEELPL